MGKTAKKKSGRKIFHTIGKKWKGESAEHCPVTEAVPLS